MSSVGHKGYLPSHGQSVSINSGNYTTIPFVVNPNLYNFRTFDNYTTLDWRYKTSLGSNSRADLFSNIALMITTIPNTTTVNTLDVNTGIYLPTVGSLAALLNYYDNGKKFTFTWLECLAGTGTTSTLTFFRLGVFVGCVIQGFQGYALSTGGIAALSGTVPLDYIPSLTTEQIVIVNQSNVGVNGGMQINPDGSMTCYVVGSNYNFQATYICGIQKQAIFWFYGF